MPAPGSPRVIGLATERSLPLATRGAVTGARQAPSVVAAPRVMGSKKAVVVTRAACGVAAGPLFAVAFTAIGARRAGYDWRRHAVSSLADGREGWAQRANFIVVGALYCFAAQGLARSPRRAAGPSVVPPLVGGAGVGLIGSGLFVTDPVAGFPPPSADVQDAVDGTPSVAARTAEGKLHDLCAIPVFGGIPAAALTCASSATRNGEYRWAAYSAGSALVMAGAFMLVFAAAVGRGVPRLAGRSGVVQRISIVSGLGWLSALSLRALISLRHR